MNSNIETSAEELALRQAQEALEAARRKLALAEEAKLQKAAADLASHRAAEEAKLLEQRKEAERIQQMWAEKRAAEEAEKKAKRAEEEAERKRLEAEVARQEELKRQRASQEEKLRQIEAATFQAEQEALRISRELTQASTTKVEHRPATLRDNTHPMHVIFNPSESAPIVVDTPKDLTSEENAQRQRKLEAAQIAAEPKRKTQRTVDLGLSKELEELIRKELKINPNPQKCDQLSAEWNYQHLITTARSVIEQAKVRPMGHDALFTFLGFALEQENPAPTVEEDTKALKAYIDKMRLPWGVA